MYFRNSKYNLITRQKFCRQVIFFSLLIFIFSCKKQELFPGYKEINGNFYALISSDSKTIKPQINDFIIADLKYLTLNDSVFFSDIRKFQLSTPDYPGAIDEIFIKLSKGDSAFLIVNTRRFFEKDLQIKVPKFLENQTFFKIYCHIIDIESYKQYLQKKERFLSWLVNQKQFEKTSLDIFLGMLTQYQKKNDLYKIVLVNGNGDYIHTGDTIIINYEGYFLDGKMFDSTWKRHQPFEFVYGTEMQVIKGLEIALKTMREKERALFVMPSKMAFGEKGSSSRIIPPYTPVIFEVQVKKIN